MKNYLSNYLDIIFSRHLLLFFVSIALFLSPLMLSLVVEQQFTKLIAILISPVVLVIFLSYPILGLIILPFISYLIPQGINLGSKYFTPGLLISAIVIVSSVLNIFVRGFIPKFSPILFILVFVQAILSYFTKYWYFVTYIQSITPLILFWLLINNKADGKKIIKYWLIAYSIFAISHVLRGGFTISDGSFLQGMANVRNAELGLFNPNVLAWTATLYFSIAIGFFMTEDKKWIISILSIVFLTIFTFSRAGIAGIIISIILCFLFYTRDFKSFKKLILPIFATLALLYLLMKMAVSTGIVHSHRGIDFYNYYIVAAERLSKSIGGLETDYFNSNQKADHNAFTKSYIEYGIFHFISVILIFASFLYNCILLLLYHKNIKDMHFNIGILIAAIVSVVQTVFGNTIYDATYAQFYFLLIGYTYLAKKEMKIN